MQSNNTNKAYHLAIDTLRAAGMGLGIYLTKPVLEKRLFKNLNLIDHGVKKTITYNPAKSVTNPVNFELAGLGGIAAYKIYSGIKKSKASNLIEGALLTAVVLGALAYTNSLSKAKS